MKPEFKVLWNIPDCIDSIPCKSEQDAIETCYNIYSGWVESFLADNHLGSVEQIADAPWQIKDEWDYMLLECYAEVQERNPITGEYETYWEPDGMVLSELQWMISDELEAVANE